MKNIKYFASLFIAGSLLVGCKSEDVFDKNLDSRGEGQLNTSSISLDIVSEALSTRGLETPTADDFTIEVYDQNNPEISLLKSLYKDLPELVSIPVGTYNIKAFYGDSDVTAEFDAPYFFGETQDVTIEANKITDIEPIECKPANVKVSIIFDESLLEEMSGDSKVVVKVGKSGELTFDADTEEAGYFKYDENSNTLAANFIGTVQGEEFNVIKTYNDVQPGYYYQITFKLNVIDPSIEGDPNTGDDNPSDPGSGDDNNGDDNNQGGGEQEDPQGPQQPGSSDPEKPNNGGSTEDPGTDEPNNNPGNSQNPGNSGSQQSSNKGGLSIDASVIYTVNTAGGEESLDPENQEYLVDGSSWDYAGDHPFNDDDVKPDDKVEDKIPEEKPSENPTPSEPENPGNQGGGQGQGGNSQPENPPVDPTPELPVLTPPQLVSDDVDLTTITDISNWPAGKRLEVKILTNSPIKKFICNIDSDQLDKETLEGVGLTDELDLVNENELWPTLRGLGFPVGEEVTNPKEMDENGNYVIHFSLTNEVDGMTFVYLLNALGSGTHKFIFHLENEAGESTGTLAIKS
ncbi:MAG: DUF4493 domain-containing protein [Muribaculaceae bacterium]|nr:DUF4493 domain-containing protein [Muribaculaceae bacterium]